VVGGGLKNHNVMITLLVCVTIIISQTLQPTAQQTWTFSPAGSMNPLLTWFDSCRNTSGWTEQTSGSGYSTEGIISGTGDLSADTNTALTVLNIPTTAYNEYGPLFTKEFPTPIALSEILDFRVSIFFENTYGVLGCLKIYLFDENKNSIFTMGISDLDDGNYDYNVIFRYSPITISPWDIQQYHNRDDWRDHISFWYNDVIETPFTLIGHSLDSSYAILTNDGVIEVDREVASIGISWTRGNHGEYDGSHLQLQEIRMIYRNTITPLHSWHHDCSNVSHFQHITGWNPTWWPQRILTLDNISSNGEAIYAPVFSSESDDWYGPAFICGLPNPVPVTDIIRFNIQLEFLYSNNADETRFDFFLFTEDLQPIVRIFFSELGFMTLGYNFGIQVFDSDMSSTELSPGHTISYSLHSNFSLWLSTTAGFFGDIPWSQREFVGGSSPVHTNREVSYFAIVPSSNEIEADVPVYIHDIHLDYINESDFSTNPISNTTNNGRGIFSLDQLMLWGISIASAFVIVAFTFQTVRHRKVSNGES